jgi:hypothetical protein
MIRAQNWILQLQFPYDIHTYVRSRMAERMSAEYHANESTVNYATHLRFTLRPIIKLNIRIFQSMASAMFGRSKQQACRPNKIEARRIIGSAGKQDNKCLTVSSHANDACKHDRQTFVCCVVQTRHRIFRSIGVCTAAGTISYTGQDK